MLTVIQEQCITLLLRLKNACMCVWGGGGGAVEGGGLHHSILKFRMSNLNMYINE